jgi:hypothetical protein
MGSRRPKDKCAVTFDEVIEALRTLDNEVRERERVANITPIAVGVRNKDDAVRA